MNGIHKTYEIIVALCVGALAANLFFNHGAGFGYAIHPYVYYAVAAAALASSVFWALTHMVAGCFFGIAAGGLLDGLKLGLILGLGMAAAKLWPYVSAAGVGVWAVGGPLGYGIGGVVLGMLLFALNKVLEYFWRTTREGHGV